MNLGAKHPRASSAQDFHSSSSQDLLTTTSCLSSASQRCQCSTEALQCKLNGTIIQSTAEHSTAQHSTIAKSISKFIQCLQKGLSSTGLSDHHPLGCQAAIRPRRVLTCRGHASEKPELPAALAETASNITFLGPGAEAMAALGDKVQFPVYMCMLQQMTAFVCLCIQSASSVRSQLQQVPAQSCHSWQDL